jgi:type VI secretion system secreted protein Hcp
MARSDMVLKVTGQRSGAVNGEVDGRGFEGWIAVLDWSWGLTAPSAVPAMGRQRTGHVRFEDLTVVKQIDSASTALMSMMSNNEILTTAELVVMRAGGAEFVRTLTVIMKEARVTSYSVESSRSADGAPTVTERIAFTFTGVDVNYTPQTAAGSRAGASSFSQDLRPT